MPARAVVDTERQFLDGDVLVQVVPVDTGSAAAQPAMVAMSLVGLQESREETRGTLRIRLSARKTVKLFSSKATEVAYPMHGKGFLPSAFCNPTG